MHTNHNLDSDDFEKLSEIYRMFGSIPRLKILMRLSQGECGASELSEVAQLSQSATSHQLKELRTCRIIRSRKDGMNVYYRLDDNHIVTLLQSGIEHIKGEHCDE